MSTNVVLYDANVLYSAAIRDLLLQLALTDLFKAKWTNEIHEEWIRNLLENSKNNPAITRAKLERTRDLMNSKVRDCLLDGYQWITMGLSLPDANDRHVLGSGDLWQL